MSVCPNCGASNGDGKFCCSCGAPLPVQQPVQQVAQPVQPVQYQPVVQPTVQPVYQQPVYDQSVYQNAVQSVEPPAKKNGLCTAGFVLSLIGMFTFGLTSIFGLIFSVIGLIVSGKKKESGKGKAIAGIIMAVIMIGCIALVYCLSVAGALDEYIDTASTASPSRNIVAIDDDDDDAPDYEKMIIKNNWISAHDGSYMVFDKKNMTFKYYMTYTDTTDNYYSGKVRVYVGKDAMTYITEDLSDLGVTKDEIRQLIRNNDDYNEDNLVCICCDHEELIKDGEKQDRDPYTVDYYGFYLQFEEDGKSYDVLDICNMQAASYVTLIREDQYDDYMDALNYSAPTTTQTDVTDTTYDTYETTEASTYETSDYSGYELVGDSVCGTIALTQGSWADWIESDGQSDLYLSRYGKMNMQTGTIINLSVFKDSYKPEVAQVLADAAKTSMEEDSYFNVTMSTTTMGGVTAYTVTGQYQDGMYLTVWYFVDSYGMLHYISVEYFDSDIASYEMVRDTYTLN